MFTQLATETGLSESCAEKVLDKAIEVAYEQGTIGRWSKFKLNRSRKLRAQLSEEIKLEGVAPAPLSGEMVIALHEAAIVIAEEELTPVERVLDALSKIISWINENQEEILKAIRFILMIAAMF